MLHICLAITWVVYLLNYTIPSDYNLCFYVALPDFTRNGFIFWFSPSPSYSFPFHFSVFFTYVIHWKKPDTCFLSASIYILKPLFFFFPRNSVLSKMFVLHSSEQSFSFQLLRTFKFCYDYITPVSGTSRRWYSFSDSSEAAFAQKKMVEKNGAALYKSSLRMYTFPCNSLSNSLLNKVF